MQARRAHWLAAALVVGQLVLLSTQVPDPSGGSTYLGGALLRAIAPLARAVDGFADLSAGVRHGLTTRSALLAENRRLAAEVERLERRSIEAFGVERELERLAEAMQYAGRAGAPLRVADVLYIDHTSWLQTLVMAVGAEPAPVNTPVAAARGLVGRVVATAPSYARAQLITDRAASLGGMIERTRRQGLVRGAGRGALTLDFVSLQADVLIGDRVVTAGIDGIYPRGIPVGTIVDVQPGDDLFFDLRVVPSVDFAALDQVYLLAGEAVPAELKEAELDAGP